MSCNGTMGITKEAISGLLATAKVTKVWKRNLRQLETVIYNALYDRRLLDVNVGESLDVMRLIIFILLRLTKDFRYNLPR